MAAILNLEEGFYFSDCIRAMVIPSLFPFLSVGKYVHACHFYCYAIVSTFPLCHEVLTTRNQSDSTRSSASHDYKMPWLAGFRELKLGVGVAGGRTCSAFEHV